MSNFYLCDQCEHSHPWAYESALGIAGWFCKRNYARTHKLAMVDHHGVGGRRYDDPLDVCPYFKQKEQCE